MKTAARVFIIIGLICSIFLLIYGIVLMVEFYGMEVLEGLAIFCLVYGIYGIITSIGCLVSISRSSKTAVVIWGIFYIPVILLASIFMFCIKEEYLY